MIRILRYLRDTLKSSKNTNLSQKLSFDSLKRIIPYLKIYWKRALIALVFTVFVSLLVLPIPYLTKYIVDDVLIAKNIRLLYIIIFVLVGVQIVKLFFTFLTSYFFNCFSQEILVEIKKDLFYHLLRLPLSFFDRNQTGYLVSRLKEVERLRLFFSNVLIRLLIGLFEFIFCIAILFHLNWKLTFISLILLPLYYVATKLYSMGIRKISREEMEKEANLSHQVQDSLSGADVIKIFSAEKRETKKIHFHLDELKKTSIKGNVILAFSSELLALLGALGGLIVLLYSGLVIIKGDFTVGSYIAFSAYLAALYGPTQLLATIGLQIQPAITALERVTELLNLETEKEKGVNLKKIKGDIEFKNVYFSYDYEPVFINLNFKIKEKEKILITGPNGSGKSTIVKLILGLYKAQKGDIIIDNYEINKVSLPSIRERISIISQNTFLFDDTIKNNILYSWPEAKETEIEESIRLAGASEFINKLDRGLDTEIGERGVRLSGGERQKISIARAFLKDSDLIIFDEATTHLDFESENRIKGLIKNNFKNKTCIIISHKIWNSTDIDRILALKDGKISQLLGVSE